MPPLSDDQERINEAIADAQDSTKLLIRHPTDSQKLGRFDVICFVLNRTIGALFQYRYRKYHLLFPNIGSGIYVTPAIVLKSTNSVGISLLLWSAGAVLTMSALLVWLELGLSVPKYNLQSMGLVDRQGKTRLECVPRNGGEKNYVSRPRKASIVPRF